jgi:predicted PurR-regulated permease PerM
VILAVAIYPLHQLLARKMGGRHGLAATLIVIGGVLIIVTPTALLMNSFADSVRGFIHDVQNDTLVIPVPREGVQAWPVIGEKLYSIWSAAHTDLPGLVQSLQPKIGDITKQALSLVASAGGAVLKFLASFIIAGILMAYGESGVRSSRAIFERVAGTEKGQAFAKLATATIRAVAQGVIGVAFIQAIVIGLALLVAGVPWAGVSSAIALVVCIAQVPAIIVTLPAIVYLWSSGDHGTAATITYTVVLLLAGTIDNVLKPFMMGRGVDAPMPVILLGALGGMATGGILGMFVGATVLTLGYQIFMGWVAVDSVQAPAT